MKQAVNTPGRALLWTVLLVGTAPLAAEEAAFHTDDPRDVEILDRLDAGHWVEVRGSLIGDGLFAAERLEVTRPRREDSLWGTAARADRQGWIRVLGMDVETGSSTRWEGGTLETAIGSRVRVRGRRGRDGGMVAHRIQVREAGVSRIAGRIEHFEQLSDGSLEIELLGVSVLVPADVKQRSSIPLSSLRVAAAPRPRSSVAADLDDFFGGGFVVTETLRLGLQHEVVLGARRNLELDDPDDTDIDERDDRDEAGSTLRARLVWAPTARVGGMLDVRHRARRRDLGGGLHQTEDEFRLGEAYLLLRDIGFGVDLQVGRQDFDDQREWLYDQNLDGIRLFRDAGPLQLELSLSTTLGGGSSRDEDATNAILYLSNRDRRRHLAAYVVHRDFGSVRDETQSHIGVRAIGRWSERTRGWAELSALSGRREGRKVAGWGSDLGVSWISPSPARLTLTAGLAHGSGDRGGSRDGRFRQTGLQDNNGRLGGITAVRYYGELMAPELSNLTIATVGLGGRIAGSSSVELIAHAYRQDVASPLMGRSNLDQRPDGVHRDLGTEIDLVVGIRRFEKWDLELVAARFDPGDAFPAGEGATLGRVQFRYRY